MRAKVASRAKGHVFEERFMKLSGLKLIIAYRQAVKEEQKDFDTLGEILQIGFQRFDHYFKELNIYTNPDLWMKFKQEEDLTVMRDQVNPDNFESIWEDTMKFAPAMVVAEEAIPDINNSGLPKIDPQLQNVLTGFLPKNKRTPKEGG